MKWNTFISTSNNFAINHAAMVGGLVSSQIKEVILTTRRWRLWNSLIHFLIAGRRALTLAGLASWCGVLKSDNADTSSDYLLPLKTASSLPPPPLGMSLRCAEDVEPVSIYCWGCPVIAFIDIFSIFWSYLSAPDTSYWRRKESEA